MSVMYAIERTHRHNGGPSGRVIFQQSLEAHNSPIQPNSSAGAGPNVRQSFVRLNQEFLSLFPADACVRNRNAIGEFRRIVAKRLIALVQMALQHHADDPLVTA